MSVKLFRISVVIAIASLLPFFFLIARKQAPPPKVKIRASHEQTVENFTLEQIGEKKWILESPLAKFSGNKILLENPKVIIYLKKDKVKIISKRAIYDKKTENSDLESVKVIGRDFVAYADNGTFFGKKRFFRTSSYCTVKFNKGYTIKGKRCKIDFSSEKFIIYSRVKTVIEGVRK